MRSVEELLNEAPEIRDRLHETDAMVVIYRNVGRIRMSIWPDDANIITCEFNGTPEERTLLREHWRAIKGLFK